jgi:hypothetical protein
MSELRTLAAINTKSKGSVAPKLMSDGLVYVNSRFKSYDKCELISQSDKV